MCGCLREICCGSDMILLNWNRDTRKARVRTVRLRCGPLKPRLTIFITAFPPEAEGFLELPNSDELKKCLIYLRE